MGTIDEWTARQNTTNIADVQIGVIKCLLSTGSWPYGPAMASWSGDGECIPFAIDGLSLYLCMSVCDMSVPIFCF